MGILEHIGRGGRLVKFASFHHSLQLRNWLLLLPLHGCLTKLRLIGPMPLIALPWRTSGPHFWQFYTVSPNDRQTEIAPDQRRRPSRRS